MMLWTNCTKLQKMLKIDLKMAKIAKLGKMSLVVCYLLPWQLGIWFCKAFYFWITPNKSWSLCIMTRHIYISLHKLPKIDLKNPKNAIFEFCSSVVYSLLPWQQHKQLIQLIAWLKMLKLCHMFVLYVFFLYTGRQLYVIFDWNRAISVDYCTIFAKILISVAMVTKMIIMKNKNIFSCSYIINFLWYQNQPNWLTIMWSHLHDFYLNRHLIAHHFHLK